MNQPHHTPRRPALAARRCRGLSLAELLVTLAVLSVLLTLSVSALDSFGTSTKLSAATHTFVSNLNMARSEAIKRNTRVALCKSVDGVFCLRSGAWHQGWIVFQDVNNNGQRESGEQLVWRVERLPEDMRVSGNLTVSGFVSYAPTGGTKHLSGAFQAGTVTICRRSTEATEARQIVLNSAGRARVHKTTVASCA